jgi:alanine dehydrogenase
VPAAAQSDVIVTCTTAREPFLAADMVAAGTFVAAVGADSPDKSEIHPALMARALVVPDLVDQCAAMGDLRHAIAAGAMHREAVHAELADLVVGARPGRTSDDQITLFDSTGTALQDVAAAVRIHERALARPGRLAIDLAA